MKDQFYFAAVAVLFGSLVVIGCGIEESPAPSDDIQSDSAALSTNVASTSGNQVLVNRTVVMTLAASSGLTGAQRATIVAQRLNAVFGDSSRDLDFVLPIPLDPSTYVVGCPLVRRGSSVRTPYLGGRACGFGGTCGDGTESLSYGTSCNNSQRYRAPEDTHLLYTNTNLSTPNSNQELIVTATSADSSKPWEIAITWANAIRGALNATNILGTKVQTLTYSGIPSKFTTVSNAIITEADPGCDPTCCVSDYSGKVYHPQEMNCASNKIGSSISVGRAVKVTASANGRSVVCRLTDYSNSNIEISHQVWVALGSPQSGNITMSNP